MLDTPSKAVLASAPHEGSRTVNAGHGTVITQSDARARRAAMRVTSRGGSWVPEIV